LGSIWIFEERFAPLQWAGLTILVVGLCVFSRDQIIHVVSNASDYSLGMIAMGAAAVTWAVYGLAQKQLLRWLSSNSVMLVIYAGCTLIFTPMARPSSIMQMEKLELAMLAFCAFNTLAAYGTFAEALAHWEASKVSAVLALTPLCTLAMLAAVSSLWPGLTPPEPISAAGWLGACLVVSGSLLTATARARNR
jgi:drug/metabolite transporter (DMT)-like permease